MSARRNKEMNTVGTNTKINTVNTNKRIKFSTGVNRVGFSVRLSRVKFYVVMSSFVTFNVRFFASYEIVMTFAQHRRQCKENEKQTLREKESVLIFPCEIISSFVIFMQITRV